MFRTETNIQLNAISQAKDKLDKCKQAQRAYLDKFENSCDDFANGLEQFRDIVVNTVEEIETNQRNGPSRRF